VKFKSFSLICSLVFVGLSYQSANAACQPSTQSGFATGSVISGNQVVVCAKESQQSSSVSTSKPVASTKTTKTIPGKTQTVTPKLNCPAQLRTTEQIVSATLAGCPIVGPIAPPARVVTVKPGKPAIAEARVSSSSQSAEAALSPRSLSIAASQTVLRVGEGVVLTSDAGEHEKTALILGRLGFVRFTPVEFEWLVDGVQRSPVAVTSFSSTGTKPISLQVIYLASTRFSLSEQWVLVGSVVSNATIEVKVENIEPAQRPGLTPRLVSASCETKPSTYRC
jgi:hypothetical protein